MQAKIQEKEKAIYLRKLGKSYSEIQNYVPVSKASLSLWLNNIHLSNKLKLKIEEKIAIARKEDKLKVQNLGKSKE